MKKRLFSYLLAAALLLTLVPVGAWASDILYGDVNGDGNINAKDATLILRYSVGKLTEDQKFDEVAANVNADEGVNAKDATLILRYSVKKLDKFPADTHEHSYEAVVIQPTCTEDGYTTYTCFCGESYMGDETDALGHDWNYGDCKRCGAGPGDVPFCGECSFTATEVIAPTCTKKGYTVYTCKVCGNYNTVDTKATGHSWGDWVETKEPATSTKSEETRTCSACGKVETRTEDDFCEFSGTGEHAWWGGHPGWRGVYDENGNPIGKERHCAYQSSDGRKCDGYEFVAYNKTPEDYDPTICGEHTLQDYRNNFDWSCSSTESVGTCCNCGYVKILLGSTASVSEEALNIINEYRAELGLQPYAPVTNEKRIAHMKLRAEEIWFAAGISHIRPDGSQGMGQCVGGADSARHMVDAWMNSDGHRGWLVGEISSNCTQAIVTYCNGCWVFECY